MISALERKGAGIRIEKLVNVLLIAIYVNK